MGKYFKGFKKPQRKKMTKEEVDKEYSTHAVYHGHKSRMLANLKMDIAKLEGEVEMHLEKLIELNKEGMKFQMQQPLAMAPTPSAPPLETGDQSA